MRWAGYELEARIGRGGMAEVLRARIVGGPRAGLPVALKRLLPAMASDPACVARFAREVALSARLRHRNIVEVLATGVESGTPFMAMEYVDGGDLRRLLSACRTRAIAFPVDLALHVAHAVALALEHAHGARDEAGAPLGIVHCDVSPGNVLVSRLGEVRLGDFGVARAAGDARASGAWGKVRYLAPEVLRGAPPGPAADVFGVGALLFDLLTGSPAFPGDDPAVIARDILGGRLPVPSALRTGLPPGVDSLVARALGGPERLTRAAALADALAGSYDPGVGTPLALAGLLRCALDYP